jgi:hypothetical protein
MAVEGSQNSGATSGGATTEPERLSRTPAGSTTVTAAEEVSASRDAIEFDVLRNALLHTMRQRWFDSLHRWLMFAIVLSGTAGVATVTTDLVGQVAFAATTALLATLDLVLDLRGKGRLHDDLRRRYYGLLAEIVARPGADAPQVAAWQAEMMRLTAEEPDNYRVVDCVAYNAAMRSLGRDPDHEIVIPWWRRQLAHVFTFPGFDPVQRREISKPGA